MFFTTKNLIATSLALLVSAPAFGAASLSSLLGGGTLTSGNGKLVFSDFAFSPAPAIAAAGDIDVTTLDSGLLFGSPIFIDSASGIIDFGISYKATGNGAQIVGADMATTGAYSGQAQASAIKAISDADGNLLAELNNVISTGNLSASDAISFAAQSSVSIDDSFSASGAGGSGAQGSAQFEQTFETVDDETSAGDESTPTAVPSPTAALAGLALLGVVGLRRRRG